MLNVSTAVVICCGVADVWQCVFTMPSFRLTGLSNNIQYNIHIEFNSPIYYLLAYAYICVLYYNIYEYITHIFLSVGPEPFNDIYSFEDFLQLSASHFYFLLYFIE